MWQLVHSPQAEEGKLLLRQCWPDQCWLRPHLITSVTWPALKSAHIRDCRRVWKIHPTSAVSAPFFPQPHSSVDTESVVPPASLTPCKPDRSWKGPAFQMGLCWIRVLALSFTDCDFQIWGGVVVIRWHLSPSFEMGIMINPHIFFFEVLTGAQYVLFPLGHPGQAPLAGSWTPLSTASTTRWAPALSHSPQETRSSYYPASKRTPACSHRLAFSTRHTGPTSVLDVSPETGQSHFITLRNCNLES